MWHLTACKKISQPFVFEMKYFFYRMYLWINVSNNKSEIGYKKKTTTKKKKKKKKKNKKKTTTNKKKKKTKKNNNKKHSLLIHVEPKA